MTHRPGVAPGLAREGRRQTDHPAAQRPLAGVLLRLLTALLLALMLAGVKLAGEHGVHVVE